MNALSQYLDLTIYRDGGIWHQRFEDGGSKVSELERLGDTKKTGTTITFKTGSIDIFSTLFSFDQIKERMRETAFLIKGLEMVIVDERNQHKEVFKYEEGIKAFVHHVNGDEKGLHETIYFEVFIHQLKTHGIEAEVAITIY